MPITFMIHYFMSGILYVYFTFLFFGLFLTPKYEKRKYWLYAFYGTAVLQLPSVARLLVKQNELFDALGYVQVLFFFGYVLVLFKDKVWEKILSVLLWMIVATVSELILCVGIGEQVLELDFLGDDPVAMIYEVLMYIIHFSLLAVVAVVWKWVKTKSIPKKIWIFLLFPISQYLMIRNFPTDMIRGKVTYEYPWQALCSLLLGIAADVILFYVMFTQGEKEKIKQQLAETEKLMEMEKGYYETIEIHREEMAKIRHDFNNQLTAALHIAKNGEGEKSVELLEQLREAIEKNAEYRWCENAVMNAVLSEKSRMCVKEGVRFTAEITAMADIGILPLHMCSILANLLDNAIHAAVESGVADAFVTVHVKQQERYVFVKVENSATESVKKEKRPGHGYGVQIIKGIAQQYNGEYQGSFEKGVYTAMVVLETNER
ncbi:MAG: sensor histidine kinase [Lachnospiraceae bacterium]|nr:sensor histidine kinase [Lachnospiraceae bacterium]